MDSIFHFSTLFVLLLFKLWYNLTTIQITTVFILIQLVKYTVKTFTSEYKYPAGPTGLPVVGSLPWIIVQGIEKFMLTMARKYGDVMTIRMGIKLNVIFNDYDLMKEFSLDPQFQDRPNAGILHNVFKGNGVVDNEGSSWKHQRRFMLHSLRDSGMGKMQMEEKINNEMEKIIKEMRRNQGQVTSIDMLIERSTCNVILGLAFNKMYEYDDPQLTNLLSDLSESVKIFSSKASAIVFFPWLAPLIKKDNEKLHKYFQSFDERAIHFIKEHKRTLDENNPRDLLDLYLMEMNKTQVDDDKTGYHSAFTEEQLRYVITDLFFAGTETTSITIRWAILYMIRNSDIQRKVQQELDDVVGRERAPTCSDRTNLPYTVATLQEVERMATIIPFSVPRSNDKPAKFKQFKFAARTIFSLNLLAVHRDPKLWQEPERFMPTRFINKEGKAFRPPHLVPFGSGKRSCAGEALAKMEIFLMFATLMQKFSFECEPGTFPTDEATVGVGRLPKPFKLRVHDRNL